MSYRDHYAVLGVEREADGGEIKRAYRKLARRYHPDVSHEPDAEKRFKEVNEAYEVLGDAEKRSLYDRYGEAWKAISEGHAPPTGAENIRSEYRGADIDPEQFADLGSLFEDLFGGSFGRETGSRRRRSPRPASGVDYETTFELGLDEAHRGGERDLRLGDPAAGEQRSYRVKIPAGVRDGQRIRLAGQGGQGAGGGPAGDLFLTVRLAPHPQFRMDGEDLHTTLPLTFWEAALGATVSVRTLDGPVKIKVPPGSSSGRRIRLRGHGWHRRNGARGDLHAEIRIVVPREPSPEERELLEKLAAISTQHPRPDEGES